MQPSSALQLHLLPGAFFVKQYGPTETIPSHFAQALIESVVDPQSGTQKFISITRTEEEVTVVGEANGDNGVGAADWRCIKIAGPMDFGITGVLCNFTTTLKNAGVPVFAMSTWNTDYILVPKDKVLLAVSSLQADGWVFASGV